MPPVCFVSRDVVDGRLELIYCVGTLEVVFRLLMFR